MLKTGLACAALAALVACGDESDYETETNPQAAVQAVSQMGQIRAGVGQGSAEVAANGALLLGGTAQNIIVPVIEEGQSIRLAALTGVRPLAGTCECTPTGCTFDDCGDEEGSWTISGGIEVSGDRYVFDLSISQSVTTNDTTSSTDMTTSGDITLGETLIDGAVSGSADNELVVSDDDGTFTFHASFDWDVEAHDIVLDAGRCPVGGSLDASVSAEASGNGRSIDYRGSGTVTFGPACGEATASE